jgi:DNA invertase Pin-like site-specific DNA recombinase
MNDWITDNKTAVAIVRKSSKEQSSISHETQENEIRNYCERHGIQLKDENIFRIVESAKNSDERKKYGAAINSALARDIRPILFYMYDRESRS